MKLNVSRQARTKRGAAGDVISASCSSGCHIKRPLSELSVTGTNSHSQKTKKKKPKRKKKKQKKQQKQKKKKIKKKKQKKKKPRKKKRKKKKKKACAFQCLHGRIDYYVQRRF